MKKYRLLDPAIWMFAAQRLCTWYPLRGMLADLLATTRPRRNIHSRSRSSLAEQLHRDGIAHLPQFINRDVIQRIRNHLEGLPLRERFAAQRTDFTIDNIPENVHVAEYAAKDIIKCADVLAIANHDDLLEAAAQYLGCKPTISNISIWWSFPADGSAQEAENFHRDVDDWRFVKFFLYLTDVDGDSGPHHFVRGSHRSGKFLRTRRYRDEEIRNFFPHENQLSIHGQAGDAFLEDTFGLHKGEPPRLTPRLLLQVQYSICPIAVYKYEPESLIDFKYPIDAYTNRLYINNF